MVAYQDQEHRVALVVLEGAAVVHIQSLAEAAEVVGELPREEVEEEVGKPSWVTRFSKNAIS